jgi:hypothetical protein
MAGFSIAPAPSPIYFTGRSGPGRDAHLRRSRKIIRGLKEGLTEEERYAVADHAVAQLKERGTSEGRKRAQARGVRFGRKPKLTPYQIEQALARRQASEALTEIGRTFGVSHSTISRLGEGA